MKKGFLISIILAFVALWGCAPDVRNEGTKAKSTTPPKKSPAPKVVKEDGYKIARGATRIQDMNVIYDSVTKGMKLKGQIEYIPVNGDPLRIVDVEVAGVLDKNGFIVLKTVGQTNFKNNEKIAAKATCLSEEGRCEDSFVDIYLYVDGIIYHHQIESHQAVKQDENEIENKEPKEDNQKEDNQKVDPTTADEQFETEGDSDVAGESGQYIGSVKEDIETLLNVLPEEHSQDEQPKTEELEEEPKSEEPKQEEPKSKEPQKDEPPKGGSKNDQPKKEEPSKGGPKVDQPKKDDKKKEEPKKDGPKKDEPKQVDPKKDDTKKDEPKKQEPKKEQHDTEHGPKKPEPAIQAIGPVNSGRLQNAADFYKYEKVNNPTGYHVIRPERKTYFATNELLYIISQMGQITKQHVPGQVLSVGDLSYQRGGKLGSHRSHQNGLDADVAYYFNNKSFQGFFAAAVVIDKPHPNWMYEEQWKLFKYMVSTQYVDRIFVHKVVKKTLCNLAIKNGELRKGKNDGLAYETLRRLILDPEFHHNHFHLRVKCSKAQKRCYQLAEPAQGSGCF